MPTAPISVFQRQLLNWFDRHQRPLPWRGTGDPYAIWVSEIMLQQTRVDAAHAYFQRFMARFPDVQSLARATEEEVLQHWAGLGYYARARNLLRAAQIVATTHSGRVPDDPYSFARLPGCGPYVTAAVQSIAFGAHLAAVDGNVKRVLARLREDPFPVTHSAAHRHYLVHAQALLNTRRSGDHNQAMMELGALICLPRNPRCARCPVNAHCRAFQQGAVHVFPTRRKADEVPLRTFVAGVIIRRNRILLVQRPSEGLLGGLWEFPIGEVRKPERPEETCVRALGENTGLSVHVTKGFLRFRHAYSHFKLSIDVFICRADKGPVQLKEWVNHRWVRLEEIDRLPLSSANRRIRKQLLSHPPEAICAI